MSEQVSYARAGAILTIDLNAIIQNWKDMQERAPEAEAAAVVKANAYGLGAIEVSTALYAAGCKTFCVAHLEEGISLRNALADPRIFVLNGTLPETEQDFADYNLIPVLSDWTQIQRWAHFNRTEKQHIPCAIQVDTGMTRLGLNQKEAELLASDKCLFSDLSPCLLMSHFACADEPEHPLNDYQISKFADFHALFPSLPASLAQSAGTFLSAKTHYDMIRPGIALYGGNPTSAANNPMKPVVTLSAKILQIQNIDTPQTVGYGASYSVTGPARMATVSLGYADGFLRAISHCAPNDQIFATALGAYKAPMIGRISMDLATFDISAVPDGALQAGSTLDVIGKFATIDDLANAGQTIPYEILTGLGSRFHRIYVNGSAS